MPHEIADQAPVLVDLPGSGAIGNAGGLHDGMIAAHVVHDADEPVVEHLERNAEDFIQSGNGRTIKMLRFDLLGYFGFFGHGIPVARRWFY